MGRMKALAIEQMNEEEDTQFNLELENEEYILIEELKQKIEELKKIIEEQKKMIEEQRIIFHQRVVVLFNKTTSILNDFYINN